MTCWNAEPPPHYETEAEREAYHAGYHDGWYCGAAGNRWRHPEAVYDVGLAYGISDREKSRMHGGRPE